MQHLIKIALFLLAGVAAFLVYGFTSLVAPQVVAVLAAGSLVGTYVGLAFADIPGQQQQRARTVAQAAMVVEAAYGTLYVLSVQYPAVFVNPSIVIGLPLALLHGASFSVLAYFVSLFVVHGNEQGNAPTDPILVVLDQVQVLVQQQGETIKLLASPPALPRQLDYPLPVQVASEALQATTTATKAYHCPSCGDPLSSGAYGAAKRYGGCTKCRASQ